MWRGRRNRYDPVSRSPANDEEEEEQKAWQFHCLEFMANYYYTTTISILANQGRDLCGL